MSGRAAVKGQHALASMPSTWLEPAEGSHDPMLMVSSTISACVEALSFASRTVVEPVMVERVTLGVLGGDAGALVE